MESRKITTPHEDVLYGLGGSKGYSEESFEMTPHLKKKIAKTVRNRELVEQGKKSRKENAEYKPVRRPFVSRQQQKQQIRELREEIAKLAEQVNANVKSGGGSGDCEIDSSTIARLLGGSGEIQTSKVGDQQDNEGSNGVGEANPTASAE